MSEKLQTLLGKLDRVKHSGGTQYMARCPAHDDKNPSLSIGLGDDGRILLHCQSNQCSPHAILAKLGMKLGDLFPPKPGGDRPAAAKLIATYPYTDASGVLLYEVCRYAPKAFKQRKPDGNNGWSWNMDGVPRVLYRLADLAVAHADAIVLIVEGEKDADNLAAMNLVATCNSGGAGKWSKLADDSVLDGRHVVIIPDNDQTGRDHADDISQRLAGRAASVRFLVMPGGAKDVSAWIESGGTAEQLCGLIDASTDALPVSALPPPPVEDAPMSDRPDGGNGKLVDPTDYRALAEMFIAEHFSHADHARLVMMNDRDYFHFEGLAWAPINTSRVADMVLTFLGTKRIFDTKENKPKRLKPWRDLQGEVMNALRALVKKCDDCPAWLVDAHKMPNPSKLLIATNGVFEIRDDGQAQKISELTPRLFYMSALNYNFNPDAPDPKEMIKLCGTMLSDEQDQIDQLQEWLGLCMVTDMTYQKMMLIIGPKRCGKGTFLDVLHAVVGGDNATGASFGQITSNFGLSMFIGKLVATIPDARFSARLDHGTLTERLLSLSSGDTLPVDVKYKDPLSLKNTARITICSNYLPAFSEQSGALASRFLVIEAGKKYGSFYQKEDHKLLGRLLAETEQIAAWGIRGLVRLRARGHFKLTKANEDQGRQLEVLTSPVQSFLDACCVVEQGSQTPQKDLYEAFRKFSIEEGLKETQIPHNTLFGTYLKGCISHLDQARPWIAGERVRVYRGVRVRTTDDDRAEAAASAEPPPEKHEFFDEPPRRRAA